MWATPSDLAHFAIGVMLSYEGQSNGVLSRDMAIEMLTPQIEDRGLGPVVIDDGGDLFLFLHPGTNEGYRNYSLAYPKRGQGVIIMTNGDNGEALYNEIKMSVSVEYDWVRDYTSLYVGITVAIVIGLLGFLLLRRMSSRNVPSVG